MKSILSILPIAGLVAAIQPPHCGLQSTVTKTETNIHYVTVPAVSSTPAAIEQPTPESQITVVETVWVTPSPVAHVPHYPYPNGTFNHTAQPTTLSTFTYVLPSSSQSDVEVPAPEPTTYKAPVPVQPSSTPVENEPVPVPTSEVPAAPEPSTAPAEVGTSSTSGKATFYGGNLSGGMCSFTGYSLPAGLFGTAFSGSAWNSGANCGRCVNVKGPNGKTIKAMVVDQCPECEPTHLDLFQNGFSQIGSISAGIIPISYDFVSCGITSPIVLKNKEGTSPYWFSMQVMNSNVAVSKLEVSTDGGKSWKSTTRKEYNYFENPSGFGTSTVDVKVTSSSGQSIIVKGVSIAASSTKTAGSNFS